MLHATEPGTLVIALFIEQVLQALQKPGRISGLAVAAVLLAIGLGLWGIRAWLGRVAKH